MFRQFVVILSLCMLGIALVSPALADERPNPKAKPGGAAQPGPASKELNQEFRGRAFQGEIANIDGNKWTVQTKAHGTLTVDVSEATLVKSSRNLVSTLNAFKVGDQVAVKLKKPDNRGNAARTQTNSEAALQVKAVHLIPGSAITHFTGLVSSIGDGKVTVKKASGEKGTGEITFAAASNLTVRSGGDTKQLTSLSAANLKAGDRVTVVARNAPDTDPTALAIVVHKEP